MRRFLVGLGVAGAWLSVAAALVGFVQPWASMEVTHREALGALEAAAREAPLHEVLGSLSKRVGKVVVSVKRGTETVAGALPDLSTIPTVISGADIPRLANRRDAHVVIALAEMWTGQRELGAKSYFVYLVPGMILAGAWLVTVFRRARLVCGAVGCLGLILAGLAGWRLATAHPDTFLVTITIEQGLWITCWAYAGLGLSSVFLAFASD